MVQLGVVESSPSLESRGGVVPAPPKPLGASRCPVRQFPDPFRLSTLPFRLSGYPPSLVSNLAWNNIANFDQAGPKPDFFGPSGPSLTGMAFCNQNQPKLTETGRPAEKVDLNVAGLSGAAGGPAITG